MTAEFPHAYVMMCAQMGGKNVAEVYHTVVSTVIEESPFAVLPLRPVLDNEYPTPSVRAKGDVPPADAPRVVAAMKRANAWLRARGELPLGGRDGAGAGEDAPAHSHH